MRHPIVRSLRQRVGLHAGMLVSASLLISISAIVGLERLRNDLSVAMRGYEEIRTIYDAGLNLAAASMAMQHEPTNPDQALQQMELARSKLTQSNFIASPRQSPLSPAWTNEHDRAACIDAMGAAIGAAHEQSVNPIDPQSTGKTRGAIFAAESALATATVHARNDVNDHQNAADARRRSTLQVIITLSIILIVAAVGVAIRQYRAVMTPLDRLAATVRAFAAGQFEGRNEPIGDREFLALSRDFNRMAAQLESFYREMQTKVNVQSRELARSQRLASVGFLAAGVSHEINNPLGIITGYAERLMRMLDEPLDLSESGRSKQNELWSQARRTLSIICDEAFRCKTITTRLLSLAHPGGDAMVGVSLVAVARQVISNLAGLSEYANRQMLLETPDGPSECFVMARAGEMQQVVLNLTLNALQAVSPPDGVVKITVRTTDADTPSRVELIVSDNGAGMNGETLERIFEPFYSFRGCSRGGGSSGTASTISASQGSGLGLSITHAIVSEHHGRINAHSDGIGKGSRITVSFPALSPEELSTVNARS